MTETQPEVRMNDSSKRNDSLFERLIRTVFIGVLAFVCGVGGSAFYQSRIPPQEPPQTNEVKIIDVAKIIKEEYERAGGDPATMQRRSKELLVSLQDTARRLSEEGYIVFDNSVVIAAPSHMYFKLGENKNER